MLTRRAVCWLLLTPVIPAPALVAQDSLLARGVAAMERQDLTSARQHFDEVLRVDSGSYEANWRLAVVLLDLGSETPDQVRSPARDSLYALAERYARRAVTVNPEGADGHVALANAIGRVSLTLSKRQRIERAVEIRREALSALSREPEHAGAFHVLGRWHAEILRLSDLQQFVARNFLGAEVFDQASWEEAERNLRLAVRHGPQRLLYRIDLAELLVEREQWAAAAEQLAIIRRFPAVTPLEASQLRRAQGLSVVVTTKRRP